MSGEPVRAVGGDGAQLMTGPMSKAAVAKLLGVSERTVDRWRSEGRLKACQVKKNGRVLFRHETVLQFLKDIEN